MLLFEGVRKVNGIRIEQVLNWTRVLGVQLQNNYTQTPNVRAPFPGREDETYLLVRWQLTKSSTPDIVGTHEDPQRALWISRGPRIPGTALTRKCRARRTDPCKNCMNQQLNLLSSQVQQARSCIADDRASNRG